MKSARLDSLRRRREQTFLVITVLCFAVLILQIARLQLAGHRRYLAKSLSNKIQPVAIPARRGEIFDRAGRPFAVNRVAYALKYFPPSGDAAKDPTLVAIASFLQQDRESLVESVREQRKVLYSYQPVTLADGLSLAQVSYVEENRAQFPGVFVESNSYTRAYPLGPAAAHLVGYTGAIGEEQLPVMRLRGYSGSEFVGKEGVERLFEDELRGQRGERDVEVDRNWSFVRVLRTVPPRKGTDLFLTIDADVQRSAYQLLDGKRGAIIVANPTSGEVIALASSPSFDANRFRGFGGAQYLQSIVESKDYPMMNRACGNGYAPGSVFKPVVLAAALETGRVTSGTTFFCEGKLEIGNRAFYCWERSGHGTVGLVDALGKSCDVAFYQMGLKLGPSLIRRYAEKFGFGETSGIQLPHEVGGFIPSPAWKRRHYAGARYHEVDRIWYHGDTANFAIGQGYLLVTPLQILQMINAIASDGVVVEPTLLKAERVADNVVEAHHPASRQLGLNEETLRILQKGLRRTMLQGGTAETGAVSGLKMAGKTGTAENLQGEPHSWFVGYFPADEPRYSFVVFIENGGSSLKTAVPVAKQLARYLAVHSSSTE